MATVTLKDGFGFDIDASPAASFALSKYLRSPGAITAHLQNRVPLAGIQIGASPFASEKLGISFDQAIALGATGVDLTLKPELAGSIAIEKGDCLFGEDDDPYRDKIAIPDGHAFVSSTIKAGLGIGLVDKTGGLQFGFSSGTDIVFGNYRLFALTDQLAAAIKTLFGEFVVPRDLDDIEAMSEGTVATVEGSGSWSFSGSANLLSTVNPLATVNAAVGNGPLKVKSGASVTVGASYTLTGEYQLRIQRLGARKFRLGYEKKRGSDFAVSVQAEVGLSGNAGFDVIQRVLTAVSGDPAPHEDAFRQAGLTDEQTQRMAAAMKTAMERSLELSVKGELDFLDTVSTAFSYEVDAAALNEAGKQALLHALKGDLSGIEAGPLSGVTPLKSIFSTLREGKKTLKINLLGIFNYGSVTDLFQKGTIVVDPQVGDITITDQVGAERIQFDSNNLVKDSIKLRKLLAESFLITITYRASNTVFQAPKLSTSYSFFELHQKANLLNMTDYLQIAGALNAISEEQIALKMQKLRNLQSFGQATLYLDSHYDDGIFQMLFLDSAGKARAEREYEVLGRQAMAAVIVPDGLVNTARLRPLTDDAIWGAMQEGTTTFAAVLGARGFAREHIPAITSDYLAIKWWADAMHHVGDALTKVLEYFSENPGAGVQDHPTLKQLRKDLDTRLATVAANTHDHFAEPWGLLVMDLASGRKARVKVQISSPTLSLVSVADASQSNAAP